MSNYYSSSGLSSKAAMRRYWDARAQACTQFGNEGECLARVARHVPVTIGNYDGLGDSGDGLGQSDAQIAANIANTAAMILRDPEGTLRVQGPALVRAADHYIVTPLMDSAMRAARPYVWRYAVPAFGLVYLLAGAAAYFSWEVLNLEAKKVRPNRSRRRRRRR